jgi:hypothetical protein
MIQFLSIIFFSWISSIFVGFFFKSSRFLCHPLQHEIVWRSGGIAPLILNLGSEVRVRLHAAVASLPG